MTDACNKYARCEARNEYAGRDVEYSRKITIFDVVV